MKNILITGGAGFIGSNFAHYILNKYNNISIIVLDKLTYAGNEENLSGIKENNRFHFVKGDICNVSLLKDIFLEYNIKGIFHFAAESHVDNSIDEPEIFVRTNVLGTFHLLETAKSYWMKEPFKYNEKYEDTCFLHVSTDEVYGSLGSEGYFTEETPYAPNSPYSATKAGSDMLVRSFYHTYGLNTIITNCSNNYGPNQHDEKLIPTIIRKALLKENIPIYGDGKNIRDWLYVEDHCKALDIVFQNGRKGEVYNIGANCEKTNIEIAFKICEILDELKPLDNKESYKEYISFVKDRPGHDKRYAIDASKVINELKWQAGTKFEKGIFSTIKWFMKKYRI
ncbi:MAG: dTDP-glucose 4,6-dehydratase [Spirochaetia bacterium]|nr:dTDP-glucose 4,6-dehydratase [Spirochaetia bacterium]